MLTRSFSSKPPSVAPAELVVIPGRRDKESATFLSGILPMSSAVTTSMISVEARFAASDSSTDLRMPVTTISWSALSSGASADAKPLGTSIAIPSADLTASAIRFI
jgi:hypothetical protein